MRLTSKTTVIIPAFNSEKTIKQCLQSIQNQTVKPTEIIVVDDNSSDKTREIASKFAKVITNKRTKGPSGARNTGGKIAKGEIVAFTDSDCIVPRDWLENIIKEFQDPRVGAVGGGYSAGVDRSFWQVFSWAELAFRRRHIPKVTSTLVSNNFACRKSLLLQYGGFPEEYPACEDMLISYKISQGNKVIWLKDNGVIHHFKTSLLGYLKHQYFFGAESTRFLLQNLDLLKNKENHQGKTLYYSMILALLIVGFLGLSILNLFISLVFSIVCLSFLFLFWFIHFLFYIPFLQFLSRENKAYVVKAYLVSFLRDIVSGFSAFDGVVRAWKTRSIRTSSPRVD